MQIDQFNWRSLTPAYLLNCYSSLPRRMVAVIAAEGGAMKHIIEKIAFYYTSQSNEPVIYNCAFYLRRVVHVELEITIFLKCRFYGLGFVLGAPKDYPQWRPEHISPSISHKHISHSSSALND